MEKYFNPTPELINELENELNSTYVELNGKPITILSPSAKTKYNDAERMVAELLAKVYIYRSLNEVKNIVLALSDKSLTDHMRINKCVDALGLEEHLVRRASLRRDLLAISKDVKIAYEKYVGLF